jgi:hypothetical protein
MNSKGEQAIIDWEPKKNSFRYSTERGDPINFAPVSAALANSQQLDADGYATADAWMAATMTHRYPLALERIVRGLTRSTLNPATILISLDNRHVNADWWTQQGSRLVTCRSTHGGLDDINSNGILLSNFTPTQDTASDRVAAQFENFPGVKNFRAEENGAEWVTKQEQSLTRIPRVPFDQNFKQLPEDGIYLRVWSPEFSHRDARIPIAGAIEKVSRFSASQDKRAKTSPPTAVARRQFMFDNPVFFADQGVWERVYALPPDLKLEPQMEYKISGCIRQKNETIRLFAFNFHTDSNGLPAPF